MFLSEPLLEGSSLLRGAVPASPTTKALWPLPTLLILCPLGLLLLLMKSLDTGHAGGCQTWTQSWLWGLKKGGPSQKGKELGLVSGCSTACSLPFKQRLSSG